MQGTFYGHQQDQDSHAACSYSENRAGTMNLTWTTGAAVSLAMNSDQFNGSKACGMCVMYRGGPLPTTSHSAGLVPRACHLSRWNDARSHAHCHKGIRFSDRPTWLLFENSRLGTALCYTLCIVSLCRIGRAVSCDARAGNSLVCTLHQRHLRYTGASCSVWASDMLCCPAGVGGGIGVTPISTTAWFMGFVNNICPECERGSLDQVASASSVQLRCMCM